jgi:signal transduction histidine kinase
MQPDSSKLVELLNVDNDLMRKLEEINGIIKRRKEIIANTRSQTALLSAMSHDLRTPLNSIIGFSELLIEGFNGTLNPSQADFIENIHESALELLESVKRTIEMHDRP